MSKKEKIAAIYCRLAQKDDDRIAVQRARVLDFASERGYNNFAEFIDNGENGLTMNRPAFTKMNAAIECGEIGAVIVSSIDRVGRDVIEVSRWLENLRKRGIEFLAIDGIPEPQIALQSEGLRKLTEQDLAALIGTRKSGYTIERARVKRGNYSDSDCYGIMLAKNSKAGWVTWQFHFDGGIQIYWGHYLDDAEAALADYEHRE